LQEAYVAAERVSEILEMELEQTGGTILMKPAVIEGSVLLRAFLYCVEKSGTQQKYA
jgi:hypothetical protein